MTMEWQGKPTTFIDPWNYFNFLSRRCPEDGSGGSCGRDLRAQPVREGRYLHHGRNWENLQEGKRNEERLVTVCNSCGTSLFLLLHPPHPLSIFCRNCFSNLCVCEQLRVPFFPCEKWPQCHSERWGSCQNVSCKIGIYILFFYFHADVPA